MHQRGNEAYTIIIYASLVENQKVAVAGEIACTNGGWEYILTRILLEIN
jgi:hypothetical protein